eukprot:scaffold1555_cov173-Amphora_coffeaeformis.AAC.11
MEPYHNPWNCDMLIVVCGSKRSTETRMVWYRVKKRRRACCGGGYCCCQEATSVNSSFEREERLDPTRQETTPATRQNYYGTLLPSCMAGSTSFNGNHMPRSNL